MRLSILVPSVAERRNDFLPKSLEMLYGQLENLTQEQQKEVEILYLIDNKTMMLGNKRNRLVDMASGDYVVFVDDDDRIEHDYVEMLLKATTSNADVITLQVSVSLNGEPPKICHYSKDYRGDFNKSNSYHRLPNHICCTKRELAKRVPYPNIKNGEDAAYSKMLKRHLRTQHTINKVLYHYDWNETTTVAQEDIPSVIESRREAVVDVVFVSDTKHNRIFRMTQNAIDTCIKGANGLKVNCIVVESRKGVKYRNAKMVYPNMPFNYNGYGNLGIKEGSAHYVMLANNDLVFKSGWLTELLAANHPVTSPKAPRDPRQRDITENTKGTQTGKHFSGWCFMMERDVWENIGGFDEDVSFYCSDDATIEQVKLLGIEPMLVPSSIVVHLGSTTLKGVSPTERKSLTDDQVRIFNKKYGQNKFGLGT